MKRLIAALVLVSTSAFAQTLKDYLDAADQANVDNRISIEQRNVAAAQYAQAWTGLFPSLSAQASWTNNQYEAVVNFPNPTTGEISKLIIIPKNQLAAVFRFELPLINTQLWFNSAAAAARESSAEFRAVVTRDQIRKQVVSSYYNYVATLAVLESAKKSLGVAEAQLKLIEVRRAAGTNTDLDVVRARAEVARNQQVVADTSAMIATGRRTLNSLTTLQVPDSIPQPQDDMRPEGELTAYQDRVDQVPSVQAADKDALAARRVALGAKFAIVPVVGAQFTEQLTNATGFQGQSTLYNTGLFASWRLDVPTFMGMRATSAQEASAFITTEKARLNARDTIHSDWQRLRAAITKVTAANTQVEAAQRASELAKVRYEAGAATQLDVIQAERDVFAAEVSQIQSRTDLAIARLSLKISAALPLQE